MLRATVYGVNNGTISTDQGNFENTGDDVVLSEHFWINFANITIAEGYIPFSTIALITGTMSPVPAQLGRTTTRSRCGPCSMNQPTLPMAIRVPAKDSRGQIRTLDFVLYAVQFQPFNFTGPSYKTGLTCSIAGRALFSAVGRDQRGAFAVPATQAASAGWSPGRASARPVAFSAEPFPGGSRRRSCS